ncbi:MAG: dTDP-4-dehydrorhamnose 3,5-epimerase [Trueperaceae bacterium]|nr:dTDP-4-dehydrorhamnose 3,5-epimerase [Trueperaceae bacterium]
MIFVPTAIEGVVVITPREHADERGMFARTFCAREFEAAGLSPVVAQANVSFNHRAGTLRGLHFQRPPAQEAKLVRCTRGRVFDVAVDVRPSSPTHLRHVHVVLDAEERNALYVPEGFAHGYLTLEDESEVAYQVSEFYAPGVEGGLRWDDPLLEIEWPATVRAISAKDAAWPLLDLSMPLVRGHSAAE